MTTPTIPKPASEHTAAELERHPAEQFPLGSFLREEMDERGWGINDVVARMGGDAGINNMCLRMLLTIDDPNLLLDDETASGLNRAFDVSKEFFKNYAEAYRKWGARTASEVVDRQPAMPVSVGAIEDVIRDNIYTEHGGVYGHGDAARALIAKFDMVRKVAG